jgi:hypothetical protein
MRCPHLTKDIIYNCDSEDSSRAPGGPCLKKYCKTEAYHSCPRFKAARGDARLLEFFRMTA